MPGVTPTWWLNYVHFTDQQREGKRPLLFHRWGGLGNHRYQIGFSGDTVSVWDSLAFQPWFTATAANVGYAYWSHDIGGHMPGAVDPELFTRWVQFGAFSPILRTHTTKNPDSERRIWAYPEPFSSILRSTFQLRYALQPYIYTEARRTYDTGVAFLRPLYYDWPEANEAYTSKDEYLFGDQMLVAPVVAPADKASGLATETSVAARRRVDRVADRQAHHRPYDGRSQFLHRADSGLPESRRDRAHAAADALHRREAGRSADRQRVAAQARIEPQATPFTKIPELQRNISAASLRVRRSRPRRPATRCAWRSDPWKAAIPGMLKSAQLRTSLAGRLAACVGHREWRRRESRQAPRERAVGASKATR